MDQVLLVFENTNEAIKSEKHLLNENVFCKIISLPVEIQSNCGFSLIINKIDFEHIILYLKSLEIAPICYKINNIGMKKTFTIMHCNIE